MLGLLLISDCVRLPVVRSSSRVKHFKIHQGDDGFHIEPKHPFSSLIDVVDFYCANSLNTTGQLGKPCKKVSLDFIPPSFIRSSCACDGAACREQPLVLHGCECLSFCFLHQKKPETQDLNHFTVDEWELPKEEFTLEEELGSGFFADVYRGRWKNHISVAIKILKSGILFSCCSQTQICSNAFKPSLAPPPAFHSVL